MLSNKPYLIRAFYDWIVDSQCSPFVVINATYPKCKVPLEHVENGEITLNVSPAAVRDLKISNDLVEFRASFSGVVHIISAPVKAVLAIYAQENQQGMFFDYEDAEDEIEGEGDVNPPMVSTIEKTAKGRAHLKLVE
ncbi:MAG TPA: ClpXP protease specificity-enhancing factor [Gammaproteobacteria bacterium]|jgi:stringent starvation protein B|nr:ClpXP protease specificity-enhancing factor [Gammaproteobacteria bacterium]